MARGALKTIHHFFSHPWADPRCSQLCRRAFSPLPCRSQAVDPSVSLAYWDYSAETSDCTSHLDKADKQECYWQIWDSEVFTSSFFGAKGELGVIGDGHWANIKVPILDDVFFDESMIEGGSTDRRSVN